ncbi:MAG: signal peptidase II [Spirochaetota bacterium]
MEKDKKKKLLPFILTLAIILADQLTKFLITAFIRENTVGFTLFGDFLRIIHARNPGIAFSMGRDLPDFMRSLLFSILPIIVLLILVIYYLKSKELTWTQRWAIAGILGGGMGNLIDRFFRPSGVVDFIDVKFFGIFGLERWPTFNAADSSVVVAGLVLVFTFFIREGVGKHEQKS